MFDLLKKKVAGFINKLAGKEEKKVEEARPKEEIKEKVVEEKIERPKEKKEPEISKPKVTPPEKPKEKLEIKKEKPKPVEKPAIETKKEEAPPKPVEAKPSPQPPEEKKREVKMGILSSIKGLVTGEVEIKKSEVDPLLEEFELELLESDVAMGVAEEMKQSLHSQLIGAKVKRGEVSRYIQATMEKTMVGLLKNEKQFDLLERMEQAEKPVKIMFLGPNGAGKTTTMGKIAHLLQQRGYKAVFAAADTFRAAAIEQLGIHAERLDVPLVKHRYGSDPTAVAFDAVAYARKHGLDAVLIDTAGRQDTNVNLLNELKKMQRVIQPDLKIYIGEALAGQALLEQVNAFHAAIGIDGVILTKLDCDPKGGTMLSVSKATGLPLLYVGIGQRYEDLERFDAERMARRILT